MLQEAGTYLSGYRCIIVSKIDQYVRMAVVASGNVAGTKRPPSWASVRSGGESFGSDVLRHVAGHVIASEVPAVAAKTRQSTGATTIPLKRRSNDGLCRTS